MTARLFFWLAQVTNWGWAWRAANRANQRMWRRFTR